MKPLSTVLVWALFDLLLCSAALAAPEHADAERKQDAARHRAMAAAHEAAARCTEAGKPEAVCLGALQASCKGLAIGKYCGMKHEH
jgi:hypothetical protein